MTSQGFLATPDAQVRLESAILDSAGYGIIATDPQGVVTQFNRAAEKLLGYRAAQVVGRMSALAFHLPDEIAARAGPRGESGFAVLTARAAKGRRDEREWTYVRRDGGHVPVLLNVTALRDAAGGVSGYLAIASDLTERRRAEARLRASEEKLRDLFRMTSLGIALTDMDGRYVEFNDAFLAICGYDDPEELRALDYWALTPRKYKAQEQRALDQLARTRRYGPYEKEYIRKSGERAPLRLNGTLVTGSDGQSYIWSIVEDISESKRVERELIEARVRAEAANQAKSAFLANVSHELRTPLNGVTAVAEALEKTPLSDRQRELVDIIRSSSAALEGILSQILDLSKIEAGRVEIAAEPFDLAAQLRQAVDLMRGPAEAKGVGLTVEIPAAAQGWFAGDAFRLRQVVTNLISNAVKFTERGEIRVALGILAPASGSGPEEIIITVSDTGIGIEPDVLPRLFDRFTQADESITRRYGGTGLGLSICRELAQLMGGRIEAVSVLGEGSRFTVTLPLARLREPPSGPDGPDASRTPPTGLRVLLAEDHPINRRVVELLLEPLAADLVTTEDGAQALEACRTGRFDLILMDMQMPVMDGLQATRSLRALEAATGAARTPVIMLTANTFEQHRREAEAAGVDDFLGKPLTGEALYSALSRLLDRAAAG